MTFVLRDLTADPPLHFAATDPTTGGPLRASILSGGAALGPAAQGFSITSSRADDPGQPMGFPVPKAEPVRFGEPARLWGEMSLSQLVINSSGSTVMPQGVSRVAVQLLPDQADQSLLWPHLTFSCMGTDAFVARYRVAMVRSG